MHNQYSNLWAIRPEAMQAVMRFMTGELNATNAPTLAAESHFGVRAASNGKNKLAVVAIHGVLTQDGPSWYGSNYTNIANALEAAVSDPDVKRVILSVDSPGGDVAGLQETAAVLASVARKKPVSAIVEGTAASAAYWLASQAHDITLTPSGEVGSVGVRMMHLDASKMMEDSGYKVTELFSGNFKTEWSPYKPLSKEAQADMQTRLDDMHARFIRAVQIGRGNRVTQQMADRRFGEGRMFSANDAFAHGLVDKIQAPRDFYRAMAETLSSPTAAQRARARLDAEKHRFSPSYQSYQPKPRR